MAFITDRYFRNSPPKATASAAAVWGALWGTPWVLQASMRLHRLPPRAYGDWPKQQCRTQSAQFARLRRPSGCPGNMGDTGCLNEPFV